MTGDGPPSPGPVALRSLARTDFPLLGTWLAAPHVARWWSDPGDPASLEARYGPTVDGDDPTEVFVRHGRRRARRPRAALPARRRARLGGGARPRRRPARRLRDRLPRRRPRPHRPGARPGDDRGPGRRLVASLPGVPHLRRRRPRRQPAVVARALERSGFARAWAGRLDTDDPADGGPHVPSTCSLARRRGRPTDLPTSDLRPPTSDLRPTGRPGPRPRTRPSVTPDVTTA